MTTHLLVSMKRSQGNWRAWINKSVCGIPEPGCHKFVFVVLFVPTTIAFKSLVCETARHCYCACPVLKVCRYTVMVTITSAIIPWWPSNETSFIQMQGGGMKTVNSMIFILFFEASHYSAHTHTHTHTYGSKIIFESKPSSRLSSPTNLVIGGWKH